MVIYWAIKHSPMQAESCQGKSNITNLLEAPCLGKLTQRNLKINSTFPKKFWAPGEISFWSIKRLRYLKSIFSYRGNIFHVEGRSAKNYFHLFSLLYSYSLFHFWSFFNLIFILIGFQTTVRSNTTYIQCPR